MVSALVLALFALIAIFAPWLAPQNPFDPAALDLLDARLPPAWLPDGQLKFPLGTDGQGRDLMSVLMFGLRISLLVSFCATLFALAVGVTLGLLSGYLGGRIDHLIMRLADMQLSFPTILVALLIDGLSRSLLPRSRARTACSDRGDLRDRDLHLGAVRPDGARRHAGREVQGLRACGKADWDGTACASCSSTSCPTCSVRCW